MKTESVDEAIAMLSQADPLPKLLQEIKLGRVRSTDAGLQAIVDSWLETYVSVLKNAGPWRLDRTSLRRLDPLPRVELLRGAGVMPDDHPSVVQLRQVYQGLLSQVHEPSASRPS